MGAIKKGYAAKAHSTSRALVVAAFLASFCAFFATTTSLRAAPNEYGETGLVENPMATTVLPMQINTIVGFKYFDLAGAGDFRVAPIGFAFGFSRTAELSMALNSYADNDVIYPGLSQSLRVGARWRFIQDVDGYPAFAVGVWGDNLMGAPGFGSRIIAQKQIDGFQFMLNGGYLYRKAGSFALFGGGFERKFFDGFDLVLDVSYSMPSDSGMDDRLRAYPALRYFPTKRIMIVASVGGGLDGGDPVIDGFVGVSFLSHDSRDIKRAKPDVPEVVQPVAPPPPEPEPYDTPRPQFKLRIHEVEPPEDPTS